jgi:type III secretion protein S
MTPNILIELTQRLLHLVLMVSLPVVAATVLVAIVVGIVQAVTQIQDQSIVFGAKLLACVAVITTMGPWAGGELLLFGQTVFNAIARLRG